MPLKLTAGVSKKPGLPGYSSVGAICHVELELDSGLIQEVPEAFRAQVREVYAQCAASVDEELARHQALGNRAGQAAESPAPGFAAANRGEPAGDGHSNGNGHSNGDPASRSHAAARSRISSRQMAYGSALAGDDFLTIRCCNLRAKTPTVRKATTRVQPPARFRGMYQGGALASQTGHDRPWRPVWAERQVHRLCGGAARDVL